MKKNVEQCSSSNPLSVERRDEITNAYHEINYIRHRSSKGMKFVNIALWILGGLSLISLFILLFALDKEWFNLARTGLYWLLPSLGMTAIIAFFEDLTVNRKVKAIEDSLDSGNKVNEKKVSHESI